MDLTDNEKLIAAIWTASTFQGKQGDPQDYFKVFDAFLDMTRQRKETPPSLVKHRRT